MYVCMYVYIHMWPPGRKYGIVTSGASLLVLEGIEQYLEHDIEPSKALLPELNTQ